MPPTREGAVEGGAVDAQLPGDSDLGDPGGDKVARGGGLVGGELPGPSLVDAAFLGGADDADRSRSAKESGLSTCTRDTKRIGGSHPP